MTDEALVDEFAALLPFGLDAFQRSACLALTDDASVLVAAPTGAGKTIVAEFAVHLTMRRTGERLFYTTPMKALSNQKFREMQERYGEDAVGLLTGDASINGDARLVVMTTEVLRNMLYEGRDLNALGFVVMDEVHYLADRFRGPVWEEVIIHLPRHVRLVSLSATVSNAEEFGDWLQAVRGRTSVIVSETRPVPLDAHVLVRDRLIDLFTSDKAAERHQPNRRIEELVRGFDRSERHGHRGRGGHNRYVQRGSRFRKRHIDRAALIEQLDDERLLPAICFIFSRAGCDNAVRQVVDAGIRLTSADDRAEIRSIVEARTRQLADEDLAVLGYWEWLEALERGVAAHHAGMLPAFKEVVEELFRLRLVTVVFATETLALGINMPARTVVLEELTKFNGEARVQITPGEYTQLTGRAGRRGIDVEGHAVIVYTGEANPAEIAGLASRRTYPLRSAFRPTYNMAVNLIDRLGVPGTRDVLETSFAQFQADRHTAKLAQKIEADRAGLAEFTEAMRCDRGDFVEYSGIRRDLSDAERDLSRTVTHADHECFTAIIRELRRRMHAHPCHRCPDREVHARFAVQYWRLRRTLEERERSIRARTGQIADRFEAITAVLAELGYIADSDDGIGITPDGVRLQRIYGERDLLVAEALRLGLWSGLDAAALAALASALVFEGRRDDGMLPQRFLPKGPFLDALEATESLWERLDELERSKALPGTEPLQTGLTQAMHRWARGYELEAVLRDTQLAAGDFVRWTKQTVDLLDQLAQVAPKRIANTAREATDRLVRGVVAVSGSTT